jgi:hypothetical protein
MHLWDRLLSNAVITLNMLRTSNSIPNFQQQHTFMVNMISTKHQWHAQEQESLHMKPQTGGELGLHMDNMGYIGPALEHYRCYTLYVTKTRGERVVETVDFFPKKFTLTFPSAQDLATQAAAEITHALLQPQPAGPFCKVGDEQTIALKRLADIFEGATRQKSKIVIPPIDGVENAAPPRVQNTVSPPRVANTTAQKIPPQPTT